MRARDLFAGVGWAVAARNLGIEDHGWDDNDHVNETRLANGFVVAGGDVRRVDGRDGRFQIEIASPSCERFSTQGHGDGTANIPRILLAINAMGHGRLGDAAWHLRNLHPKAALVVEPLRVLLENPHAEHAVWEQVPSVRPIWDACARILRSEGWSVDVGVVDAYWYRTPQNRRRAVLVARRDGKPARIPEPTARLNLEDAFPELPTDWCWRSNYSASGALGRTAAERGRTTRTMQQPAATITRKAWNWLAPDGVLHPAPADHSARIQGFPAGMAWPGSVGQQRLLIGNAVPVGMAEALLTAAAL